MLGIGLVLGFERTWSWPTSLGRMQHRRMRRRIAVSAIDAVSSSSPHVVNRSTSRPLMYLLEPTPQTVDALNRLVLSAGVDVRIKI